MSQVAGLPLLQSTAVLMVSWVDFGSLNVEFYNQATFLTDLNMI